MANLMHLIYASKASDDLSEADILALLDSARRNNRSLNVTGMLVFDRGSFLQILEGEEETVSALYARVVRDGRHGSIVKIVAEAIPERQFDSWTMGYASLSKQDLRQIEGMNDFFKGKTCLADVDEGRAKKILDAFAKGRWRME